MILLHLRIDFCRIIDLRWLNLLCHVIRGNILLKLVYYLVLRRQILVRRVTTWQNYRICSRRNVLWKSSQGQISLLDDQFAEIFCSLGLLLIFSFKIGQKLVFLVLLRFEAQLHHITQVNLAYERDQAKSFILLRCKLVVRGHTNHWFLVRAFAFRRLHLLLQMLFIDIIVC